MVCILYLHIYHMEFIHGNNIFLIFELKLVIDNNLSRILVLEKIDYPISTYDTRAYYVDLSDMDMWPYWNVSDCESLSPDSCDNWNMTLNATLTNNFACDINKTISFINNVHVDAISFTGNGIGFGDRYFFMLRGSDNNDDAYVFLLFLSICCTWESLWWT